MKNLTNPAPMLPGFYLPLRGRKPRSAQQVFADKIAFSNENRLRKTGDTIPFKVARKAYLMI